MKFTFAPESTPLPGLTIKRAIHRGGFGEVYYGLTDAGKEVALKLLHQHTDIELRGATACLNLNHPHLVTIYDIKTDADGDHWIVMEYVGGKRLSDVLEEREKLPVEEIERWIDGIAAGLTFLHDRGIAHRDLKPSNVFSENGLVKVGDVGLSKFISESRRSAHTQSVGTVYYMAPEVARGRYGREVDVYALGIMIYEMFTGDVPFDGESAGEILMKHLSERPNLEKLPPAVRPAVARALEKDPQKRTPTVGRLRDEFKAAVRGRMYDDKRFEVVEEPQELTEDSFIDRPHPGAAFAAAQADAQDYSQRARQRADAYRRDVQGWSDRQCHYTDRERAAVASAFGPSSRGCGSRRHRHGHHRGSRHPARCCGGLFAEIQKRPWLILIAVVAFLVFTRAGRGMLPGLMELTVVSAVAGAYIYLIIVLFRYFTRSHMPPPASVHVPVNAGKPPRQGGARQYVAPPAARRPEIPTPLTQRTISAWNRASQMSGALTIAPIVVAILTACISSIGFLTTMPEIAFFGASVLLAGGLVLTVNKFVEGRSLTKSMRRLLQAELGVGVGAAVWLLHTFLMHEFSHSAGDVGGVLTRVGDIQLISAGGPNVIGFMAFFGVLLLSGMWWQASDAYRSKRFSIWRTILVGLIGFGTSVLLPMPIAWAIVWSVTTFSVVQLAAPWTPPEKRVAAQV